MTEIFEKFRNDPNIQNIQKRHYTSVHVAVLVSRGKIIAHAHNKIGSRSQGCGYSNYSIHAEKNVVKEAGDINKLKGANMYVFRLGRGENSEVIMNSKPCYGCTLFLEKCMNLVHALFLHMVVGKTIRQGYCAVVFLQKEISPIQAFFINLSHLHTIVITCFVMPNNV